MFWAPLCVFKETFEQESIFQCLDMLNFNFCSSFLKIKFQSVQQRRLFQFKSFLIGCAFDEIVKCENLKLLVWILMQPKNLNFQRPTTATLIT